MHAQAFAGNLVDTKHECMVRVYRSLFFAVLLWRSGIGALVACGWLELSLNLLLDDTHCCLRLLRGCVLIVESPMMKDTYLFEQMLASRWQRLPLRSPSTFQAERGSSRRGILWLGQTCNLRCQFCYFLDRIEDENHPEHPS